MHLTQERWYKEGAGGLGGHDTHTTALRWYTRAHHRSLQPATVESNDYTGAHRSLHPATVESNDYTGAHHRRSLQPAMVLITMTL